MIDWPSDTRDSSAPLLTTKLHPPRLAAALVSRERLLAQLDRGLECKLTLIRAPAGFGKTTLLSQWLAKLSTAAQFKAAWISLDEGDNDPVRFWRYVLAACQLAYPELSRAALALLHPAQPLPFGPVALEPVLIALLNDLARLPGRGLIILEDYHLISAPQIHASVAYLIDHLPSQIHLVVLTRDEPPLPLAQLRARGELNELYTQDLRFSPAEIDTFLAQALPFALPASALAHLHMRTEGWAAGLRLAALMLHDQAGTATIAQALDTFHGSQRQIADYLAADVLVTQSEAMQLFLLQTSILSRLSAALCDAVTGRSDSASLLRALDHANLFVTPLDTQQQWFRYHALFAEAMQHAARQQLGDAALRACYRRASDWYAQASMLPDAIDAALAAEDWVRAIALLEQLVAGQQHLADPHEPHTLRRWLAQLPRHLRDQHPALCFSSAITLLRTSDPPVAAITAELDSLLRLAEQGWRSEGNQPRLGAALAMRALVSLWQGQLATAAVYSRQALVVLPAEDVIWRGICLGFVGADELRAGQLNRARQTLLDARARNEANNDHPASRASTRLLGQVCAEQSELRQAAELYRRVLADAIEHADRPDQAMALLGLAELHYEWNDLDAADHAAQMALDLGEQLDSEMLQSQAALRLACSEHARGQSEQAAQRLAVRLARLQPQRAPLLYRAVLAGQARLQLAAGDLAAVQRWATSCAQSAAELPLLQEEQEALILARLRIAQGDTAAALDLLEHWQELAQAHGHIRAGLAIMMLLALARAASGEIDTARRTLRQALAGAQAEGYQRLFLDEGDALAALLRALVPALRERQLRAFAQNLLLEHSKGDPAELLSAQERRVLALLADGCSNPQIAEELVVSVNTVKTQLKSIYRKLNVTSRQSAAAVARRQQLL